MVRLILSSIALLTAFTVFASESWPVLLDAYEPNPFPKASLRMCPGHNLTEAGRGCRDAISAECDDSWLEHMHGLLPPEHRKPEHGNARVLLLVWYTCVKRAH